MAYRLRLLPYCGSMNRTIEEGELAEVRTAAGREIKRHREVREYPVTILERGSEWELESDPDGEHMVSDNEGILRIVFVCDECGKVDSERATISREDAGDIICDDCQEDLDDREDDLDDIEFCRECSAILEPGDVDYCAECQAIEDGEGDDE